MFYALTFQSDVSMKIELQSVGYKAANLPPDCTTELSTFQYIYQCRLLVVKILVEQQVTLNVTVNGMSSSSGCRNFGGTDMFDTKFGTRQLQEKENTSDSTVRSDKVIHSPDRMMDLARQKPALSRAENNDYVCRSIAIKGLIMPLRNTECALRYGGRSLSDRRADEEWLTPKLPGGGHSAIKACRRNSNTNNGRCRLTLFRPKRHRYISRKAVRTPSDSGTRRTWWLKCTEFAMKRHLMENRIVRINQLKTTHHKSVIDLVGRITRS